MMKITKNVYEEIISWSNTKFSEVTSLELYSRKYGELERVYFSHVPQRFASTESDAHEYF